jgi:hypothetical protein
MPHSDESETFQGAFQPFCVCGARRVGYRSSMRNEMHMDPLLQSQSDALRLWYVPHLPTKTGGWFSSTAYRLVRECGGSVTPYYVVAIRNL